MKNFELVKNHRHGAIFITFATNSRVAVLAAQTMPDYIRSVAAKRLCSVALETAQMPTWVRVVCHRLMFKKGIIKWEK